MTFGLALLCLILVAFIIALIAWYLLPRRFKTGKTVANAYDGWTQDQLLERLWGEHIHLGYYGNPAQYRDFRQAKADFVIALAYWGGLDKLPLGSRVLDVGCGIGGSSRLLASHFGFEVVGVSISAAQVERAKQLTPANLNCSFAIMDALDLQFVDGEFDAVWTVECAPHIADKQNFANELMRMLKPGGVLVAADWNQRDSTIKPFSPIEEWILEQLRAQWAHPAFSSITSFSDNLIATGCLDHPPRLGNWSQETLPSWLASISEGVKRPKAIFSLGPIALIKAAREIPTLLLMHWAFSSGLMQFGLFKAERCRL
jgi:MPBQ/MSBQ methyltransferase